MTLSRREFLKLSGLAAGVSLAGPHLTWTDAAAAGPAALELDDLAIPWPPGENERHPLMKGRVTVSQINLYSRPNFKSDRLGSFSRDEVINLHEAVESPYGPAWNPRWYQVANGFVHSAYIQRVEKAHLNAPMPWVPENGRLGEVTQPYVQTLRHTRTYGWVPLYRLYYESVHWITGITEGPDGTPWYELTDELLKVKYCVPATHMRPIYPEELEPISPYFPADKKRIEVSIAEQTLTAYEGEKEVLHVPVSTGLRDKGTPEGELPTDTPEGYFHVEVKVPSKHMGDGDLTDDIEAYELVGVPWVSFFHRSGVALHGTYWHDNFGRKMSHGCVNMRNEDAKWIYRWSNPVAGYDDWNVKAHGTLVRVLSERG